MKIGKINQQGDITTRTGTDSTNPESPDGESFNILVALAAAPTPGINPIMPNAMEASKGIGRREAYFK